MSSRKNAAAFTRQAVPLPCTRACSGAASTSSIREIPSMPSSPTKPTSRLSWLPIGVIKEMKLSIGKKTWRMRSPGWHSTSPKRSSPACRMPADVDDPGGGDRQADDFSGAACDGDDMNSPALSQRNGRSSEGLTPDFRQRCAAALTQRIDRTLMSDGFSAMVKKVSSSESRSEFKTDGDAGPPLVGALTHRAYWARSSSFGSLGNPSPRS